VRIIFRHSAMIVRIIFRHFAMIDNWTLP